MGAHGHYKPYGPMPMPHISKAHNFIAKALGATMWFWVFYRLREVSNLVLDYSFHIP